MNGLFQAAKEVCDFMEKRRWKFCIIGGLAVQKWGEPRTTLDADFALLTGWGEEEPYIDALLNHFESRISDARQFALAHRILLVRTADGTNVDIALGALPFEESMMERAVQVDFSPKVNLRCCTPEDLVIMKCFAGRPRDWLDAESIVMRQEQLDTQYIITQLAALCELTEKRESMERARKMLAQKL